MLLADTVTSDALIAGTVITEPAAYNIGWSYNLDPGSISFFELSIEVGDETMRYIEEHIDEVGSAFLPNSRWTRWTSLVGELQPRSAAKPTTFCWVRTRPTCCSAGPVTTG